MVKLVKAQEKAYELVSRLAHDCVAIMVAGSIRREKPDVKDIEIVAIPKFDVQDITPQPKVQGLAKFLGLVNSSGNKPKSGKKKKKVMVIQTINKLFDKLDILVSSGILKVGNKQGPKYRKYFYEDIPVDLFLASPTNWGYILLLRTGPAAYSKQFVTEIKIQGKYQVNSGYVYHKKAKYFNLDNVISIASEKELYALLKFPYKTPRDRIKGIF